MNNYRVIVSHPAQQHSYKLAAGVKKAGMLSRYITAIYDKKGSPGMAFARILVRGRDSSKLGNRHCEALSDEEVELHYTLLSLAVIILSRSLKTKPISYRLDRWIADRFGIKVAKAAIRRKADAVICFSSNAESCFRYLKRHAPQITRIIDCASATVHYMSDLYEKDMALTGNSGLRREVPSFFDPERVRKEQTELDLTDLFFVPSSFTADSLAFCGVPREKMRKLPYGSNFPLIEKTRTVPEQIRFIYVGQVSYRKGVHHLLRVFREFPSAELDVVGQLFSQDLYDDYHDCENIHFHGQILHERVIALLDQAHVGICDLIREGENGFTFAPSDSETLRRHVRFFMEHPEELPRFSEQALITAAQYSWETYERRLSGILQELPGR